MNRATSGVIVQSDFTPLPAAPLPAAAQWAADAEAAVRTTVDTARLAERTPFHTIPGAVTA